MIQEIIQVGHGIFFSLRDGWGIDQIIVVGRKGFDTDYLKATLRLGKKYGFRCQFMSQEDFLEVYLKGGQVRYRPRDPRIRKHRGLSYLSKITKQWISSVHIKRVNWQILPPGEYPFQTILGHYRHLQLTGWKERIDEKRLQAIHDLGPSEIYVGTDDFRRYVIFYFGQSEKAVLECPVYGNAIYVITGDWETLAQYSKAQLLRLPKGQVARIIHTQSGKWLYTLAMKLGT